MRVALHIQRSPLACATFRSLRSCQQHSSTRRIKYTAMADAPAKQEKEHVKAAPPPADIASDPEEDDLSDLDGTVTGANAGRIY